MISYLIGIDYSTASIEERERAYRLRRRIEAYWRFVNPGGVAVLTTCNRIEIYGISSSRGEAEAFGILFRQKFKSCFKNGYVIYGDNGLFAHAIRLACGLKSRIKGEPQIVEQLEVWLDHKSFPGPLKSILSRALESGKEVRARSGIDRNKVDIADLVLNDLGMEVASGRRAKVLVMGTGKIASLIAEKQPGSVYIIFAARKKLAKAKRLAKLAGGEAILYEEIDRYLDSADAVVSATSSPHRVLAARNFASAIKTRRTPLYIYDLAMPRDVAPDIHKIPFVVMRDVEGLIERFYRKESGITRSLELASKLIGSKIAEYKESTGVKEYTDWHTAQPIGIEAG
ncbi:MAG: hypothetical protein HQ593_01150 [Candidatus Omnitrophica bacterium]|nr:hypothetical protein [Candidatus Omnitrophota bacterium]